MGELRLFVYFPAVFIYYIFRINVIVFALHI